MKLYNATEAKETLSGIFGVLPSRTLGEILASLMVKYAEKNNGWTVSDYNLTITKQENGKFSIKIGDEE
jgi:hypothetical protein